MANENVIDKISIKQSDGTYTERDIGVDYTNVSGLSTEAIAFKATSADKATADKNNKDITTYVASISKNGANIRTTNGAGTSSDTDFTMGAATSSAAGSAGFVPAPAKGKQNSFLRGDKTWAVPTNTTYAASSNVTITGNNNTIDLSNSGVTANSYGPSADVTGSNGATILIPKFTVDAKGRLTSAGTQTYTSVDTQYSNGGNMTINNTAKTIALASHASTGTGFGTGTASNYGHVKLSDTYNSLVSGGAAANGLAASQNALYNAYNELNSNLSTVSNQVSNSGDAYSSTKAYAIGELCIYNNVLYRCTTACSAGSWATNQSCFTADTLVNVFNKTKIKSIFTDWKTTDNYGRIEYDFDVSKKVIVCILSEMNDEIVLQYRRTNNKLGIQFISTSDNNRPVAQVDRRATIFYVDI